MAKDPAILFYPGDYITGTMGMTFEEKGAYIELLMMQFSRGHMTTHMIGQVIGQLWVKIKDKFIQDENGLWYNKRLDEEIFKRHKFTESRRNNLSGNNQYSKKEEKSIDNYNKIGHMGGHLTSHMENENENRNENKEEDKKNVAFEKFWTLYDKKIDRKKCETLWVALNSNERDACIAKITDYKEATPDKQYRRDPATYLRNKAWNNEIIKQNGEIKSIDQRESKQINSLWNTQSTLCSV